MDREPSTFSILHSPFFISHLSFFIAFACLTLLITYPLPLQLASHLAGDDYDVWARPWATWWTKYAISEGQSFYHTDMLFHPQGVSLIYHSFSHANTAIALLLEPSIGVVAAHNVSVLLAYALSGFGMYLLARDITDSAAGGLVAGSIFAFSTYHVDQSSHLIILTTQWIPIWIMFVMRLFREPTKSLRRAGLAALFLILTALSSWHLLIFSALWLALYLLYLLVWERERLNLPNLGALALMGAITFLVIAPLFLPLLMEQLSGEARGWVSVAVDEEHTTDLLAFFVPSRRHPLFGPLVEPLQRRIGRRQVFLGYTALALALIGLIKFNQKGRQARFWALSTLAFFTASLGAYVYFNGATGERPLQPWLIPFTKLIRDPARLTVMTTLGLALLAGMGAAWLTQRRNVTRPNLIALGLTALVLFEYLPWPFPTTPVDVPAFYEQIRGAEEPFALADIPVRQLELRRLSMFYQITHQKPIVEGIVGRTPPEAYAFIERHPILSAFESAEENPDQPPPGDDLSRRLDGLAETPGEEASPVRYLVLHRRFLTAHQIKCWRDYLPYDSSYEDDQIIVYRTRPALGEELQVRWPINEALGLAHMRPETRYPRAGEPLSLEAAWVAARSIDHTVRARWSLIGADGSVAESIEGELCADWPSDEWQAGDFGWGRYELPTALAPGPYRLHVRLEPTGDGRDVGSLLILPVEGGEAAAEEPVASFDELIALDRLRLLPGDGMLHLQLDWRALRAVEQDYKLFVHLFNSAGELVAQLDTMPRDWAMPTSTWSAGETLGDLVSLDTFDLPAGAYRLSLGLYDAATQDRLPLRLPDGALAPDAALQKEIRLP